MIQHFKWLDIAKGIGIILVIMDHTVFLKHEFISLFHMPLFFFLSGITLREGAFSNEYVLKKAKRILVPYLFFSAISFVAILIFRNKELLTNGPIWFLQSLFIALMCSSIVVNLKRSYQLVVVISVLSYLTITTNGGGITMFPFDLDFDRSIFGTLFLLSGFYMRNFLCQADKRSTYITLLMITAFIYFVTAYTSIYMLGVTGSFLDGRIYNHNLFMFMIAAITGTLALVYFSKIIGKASALEWLGRNSLAIMCVHYPIAQFWNLFMSSLTIYNEGGIYVKALFAIISYIVILLASLPIVIMLKKYMPQYVGYK